MRFRKKPVVIEAVRWDGFVGDGTDACKQPWPLDWPTKQFGRHDDETWGSVLVIDTLEGRMMANVGDWIIHGVKGEFYACKPDIFAATYEPAEPAPASAFPEPALGPEDVFEEPQDLDGLAIVLAAQPKVESLDDLLDGEPAPAAPTEPGAEALIMTKPCFECNGTGQMCDVCGEAENACFCDADEDATYSDCEACGGTGQAAAAVTAGTDAGKEGT